MSPAPYWIVKVTKQSHKFKDKGVHVPALDHLMRGCGSKVTEEEFVTKEEAVRAAQTSRCDRLVRHAEVYVVEQPGSPRKLVKRF